MYPKVQYVAVFDTGWDMSGIRVTDAASGDRQLQYGYPRNHRCHSTTSVVLLRSTAAVDGQLFPTRISITLLLSVVMQPVNWSQTDSMVSI